MNNIEQSSHGLWEVTDRVKKHLKLTISPKLEAFSLNMQHLSVQSFLLFYPPVSLSCLLL